MGRCIHPLIVSLSKNHSFADSDEVAPSIVEEIYGFEGTKDCRTPTAFRNKTRTPPLTITAKDALKMVLTNEVTTR
jgi:hypothetical protein